MPCTTASALSSLFFEEMTQSVDAEGELADSPDRVGNDQGLQHFGLQDESGAPLCELFAYRFRQGFPKQTKGVRCHLPLSVNESWLATSLRSPLEIPAKMLGFFYFIHISFLKNCRRIVAAGTQACTQKSM